MSSPADALKDYRHTQPGTLTRVALGGGAALTAALFALAPEGRIVSGVVLAVLIAAAFLFHSLTVEIRRGELVVSFGPGLIRKRWRLAELRDARAVKNRWFYGWGIRWTPRGWLYNVSGLDAVELEWPDRGARVGTDEPDELLAAVREAAGLER